MQVLSGSYTGNGTSQTVNVGFQPDVVFIKNNLAADTGVVRTSTMFGDITKPLTASGGTRASRSSRAGSPH